MTEQDAACRIVPRPDRDVLGEGLLWSPSQNAVYWVDIVQCAVHRLALGDGAMISWTMPEMIGWLVERADKPGFIAGFQSGFAELSLEPAVTIQPIGFPQPEHPENRLNDALVDSSGRIWAGTMHPDAEHPTGALFRLDTDHRWTRHDAGYFVTNGPAISPDGAWFYHADSLARTVYRFTFGPEGTVSDRKAHIVFDEADGLPDGMTCDAEGGLWVAHWGGGRVSRFLPDGVLDRAIAIPTRYVTNMVFAGAGLDRMFVTSAVGDDTPDANAGALFEVDPAARGLAPNLFAG